VFITLLLLCPIALAASFMVYFFARDNRTTRGNMFYSIILSIISVSLWCVWNLIFFLAIYKRDTVYSGIGAANDESNYHTTPKRTYLFTVLAETAIILTFLTYYTCVANEYVDLMNDKYNRQKKEDEDITLYGTNANGSRGYEIKEYETSAYETTEYETTEYKSVYD